MASINTCRLGCTTTGTPDLPVFFDEFKLDHNFGARGSKAEIDEAWRAAASKHGWNQDKLDRMRDRYTMHHEVTEAGGEVMQMVDKRVHEAYQHTGGRAIARGFSTYAYEFGGVVIYALIPETAEAYERGADVGDFAGAATWDLLMWTPAGDGWDLGTFLGMMSTEEGRTEIHETARSWVPQPGPTSMEAHTQAIEDYQAGRNRPAGARGF